MNIKKCAAYFGHIQLCAFTSMEWGGQTSTRAPPRTKLQRKWGKRNWTLRRASKNVIPLLHHDTIWSMRTSSRSRHWPRVTQALQQPRLSKKVDEIAPQGATANSNKLWNAGGVWRWQWRLTHDSQTIDRRLALPEGPPSPPCLTSSPPPQVLLVPRRRRRRSSPTLRLSSKP